jgi:OOP family OmpA-OmpF porin
MYLRNYILKLHLAILLFSVHLCSAQNLVPNPSFEGHTDCPEGDAGSKFITRWYQPTKGSTDYFNMCAATPQAIYYQQIHGLQFVGVPDNFRGFKNARTGKGYIGMIFYSNVSHKTGHEYREYLTTKLIAPLLKGKQYIVYFYVSLSPTSTFGLSDIQVLFTPDSVKRNDDERLPFSPQLSYSGAPIMDTAGWTKVSWTYTAQGDEQFMTLGNFTPNEKCKLKKDSGDSRSRGVAYYYVDDVCVSLLKRNGTFDCGNEITKDVAKPIQITENQDIAFTNVFFETDKYALSSFSFQELDTLLNYLHHHSFEKIEISGYTDNTGMTNKNLKLSKARAKAVADYLISKGIAATRVNYNGYGSDNPVADNDTEQGKKKNRRVEFRIESK